MRLFINIVIVVFLFNLIACENEAPKVDNKVFDGVWYEIGWDFGSENLDESQKAIIDEMKGLLNTKKISNIDDFEGVSFIEFSNDVMAPGKFELTQEKKLIRNYEFSDLANAVFILPDTLVLKDSDISIKSIIKVVSDTLKIEPILTKEQSANKAIPQMIMQFKKLPDYVKLVD